MLTVPAQAQRARLDLSDQLGGRKESGDYPIALEPLGRQSRRMRSETTQLGALAASTATAAPPTVASRPRVRRAGADTTPLVGAGVTSSARVAVLAVNAAQRGVQTRVVALVVSTRTIAVAALMLLIATGWATRAEAYPDWRSPRIVGVAQEGVFRFPQAVAYDASGTRDPDPQAPAGPYVYVADQYSFFVQKFTAAGNFVRRFGGYGSEPGRFGATSASASPTTGLVGGISGLAVDGRGHVYVLDSFNSRVERFSPGGEFEGQFGSFGSALGELNPGIHGGLALSGDRLYVADLNNNRVQRFRLGSDGLPDGPPIVFGAAGSGPGQFDLVQGVAVDPAREHAVFAVDDLNHRVHRFSADGSFEALVGSEGSGPGQLDQPYDAGVDLAGRLFVADNQNHRIARFNAATLAFQANFGAGPGLRPDQLNNVRAIAVAAAADAAGGVFATNTSLNQIAEFGADGAHVRSWGADGRGPGAFMNPRDVAIEPNGDIIVADTRADRVAVLRANGAVETWAKLSSLQRPLSGAGKREFRDPTAVAVDPRNGDVYVAEGGGHRVQRIHQDGDIQSSFAYGGSSAGSAPGRFREPLGIAVGPDGTVWVADTRNDRLQRLDPQTGAWSVFTGFVRPTAVAVLADGRLAVTELGADAVLDPEGAAGKGRLTVITPDGGRLATYDGLDRPEGVADDRHGGVLVAETQRDRLLGFRLEGGQLVQAGQIGGPGASAGRFARPMGIDIDASGRLLVADTYNNRLQRFEAPADSEPGQVGGTVPAALDLSLGAGGSFPAFTPGVQRTYTTTVTWTFSPPPATRRSRLPIPVRPRPAGWSTARTRSPNRSWSKTSRFRRRSGLGTRRRPMSRSASTSRRPSARPSRCARAATRRPSPSRSRPPSRSRAPRSSAPAASCRLPLHVRHLARQSRDHRVRPRPGDRLADRDPTAATPTSLLTPAPRCPPSVSARAIRGETGVRSSRRLRSPSLSSRPRRARVSPSGTSATPSWPTRASAPRHRHRSP